MTESRAEHEQFLLGVWHPAAPLLGITVLGKRFPRQMCCVMLKHKAVRRGIWGLSSSALLFPEQEEKFGIKSRISRRKPCVRARDAPQRLTVVRSGARAQRASRSHPQAPAGRSHRPASTRGPQVQSKRAGELPAATRWRSQRHSGSPLGLSGHGPL